MRFRMTLKDSDAFYGAIVDTPSGKFPDRTSRAAASALADRWLESGEYLTVEIDTEAETCIVVPVER